MTFVMEFLIKALIKDYITSEVVAQAIDIVFIVIFSVAFMVDLGRSKKIKELSVPLYLGYSMRLFFLFWDLYGRSIFTLPNSGADSEAFYNNVVCYTQMGFFSQKSYFAMLMGTMGSVIGSSRLYLQYIIMLFSIVALLLFALMLEKIDISSKIRYYVCLIVCLLPNLAILSSLFLRESLCSMFIIISIYTFYDWMSGKSGLCLVFSFVAALSASAFHSGCIAIPAGYIGVIMLYDRQNQLFRFKIGHLIGVILIMLIMAFLFEHYSDSLFYKFSSIEDISDIATGKSRGGSSYAQYVGDSKNLISMIVFTPLRMIFFLFSPMPWMIRGISDIIAFFFSSLFYLTVVWCDIKYICSKTLKNRTLVIVLSIIVACTVVVFSWGTANSGTACRHRDKIAIIFGLIMALTYKPKKTEYQISIRSLKSENSDSL